MLTVVNNASNKVQKNIGYQIIRYGNNYIRSPFVKKVECNDGLLVYNTLTSEVILIDEDEFNNPNNDFKRWLIERWYYLDEKIDAISIADMFRQIVTSNYLKDNPRKNTGYVIMSTTACNARCFYCYECGYKQKPMTDDVALNVAKYLLQASKQKFHITWFGGEPLCNPNAIRIISKHLNDNGADFKASMISNGYLLDQFTIEELKNDWRINQIQITIDGTKEVYQEVKNYRNNDENAYEKILCNIERLLENNIGVALRMNVGLHNGDDLLMLIKQLADKFSKYKDFYPYAVPLFIGEGDPPLILTDEEADKLYINVKNACSMLKEMGFKSRNFNIIIEDYKPTHCMADSESSKMITVEGNLTPCEHYAYSEICGNIYDGVTDHNILDSWKEKLFKPECRDCYNYPKCVKIKKCPTDNICEKPQRMLMDYQIEIRMLEMYDEFKERKEKKES